jgi:hypothetical protein
MLETILNNLSHIVPELIVTVTLCIVLLVHLVSRKSSQLLTVLSLIGLFSALFMLISNIGINVSAFSGMLSVDPFATFFKILIVLSTIVIVLMSRFSDEINAEQKTIGEYYFLVLSMCVGMMFMVGSSNLIMMYLTLELSSLTSYIASGFTRKAKDSSEASLKYLLYGAFSSGVMLYGISIIYGLTGTLDIAGVNQILVQGSANGLALIIASIFILVGFGYKISAVPVPFLDAGCLRRCPADDHCISFCCIQSSRICNDDAGIQSDVYRFIGDESSRRNMDTHQRDPYPKCIDDPFGPDNDIGKSCCTLAEEFKTTACIFQHRTSGIYAAWFGCVEQ